MKVYVVLIALAAAMSSCHTNSNEPLTDATDSLPGGFPPVIAIEKLKTTVFVPTLESRIPHDKNVIYTPTLLFAWDEVKEHLPGGVLPSDGSSADFLLLNKSASHQASLGKAEFKTTVYVSRDTIRATASFNKSLPFYTSMQRWDTLLRFNKQPVVSFGIYDYNYTLTQNVDIVYYKDDDHFCIKLIPADSTQEIILMKGIDTATNLDDIIKQLKKQERLGQEEANNSDLYWKRFFTTEDKLLIPALAFNIAAHYPQLEGQTFTTGLRFFEVITAAQRTALVFNEHGSMMESEAEIAVSAVDSSRPRPKTMLFDKPFLLMMKKKTAAQAYFVMLVNNTELMIPSKKE
ncbi:hypothetical protein SAMN05660461_1450 [Chitinophaga ginsengisegetis]|uniref:Serpin B n=1 Tax=Chitinophaga ginsengisegetis TaxID=393003 RepID=A0A1T5NFW9_9BACT|nr:hypothetical protein [Chitinophaga ginsengisegetis]SKC99336.1 hypothetical protein SAMN05660461_1450 [Chitinophaga ginsengisegetis]